MAGSSDDQVTRPRRFPEVERREASLNALELEPLMTVCPKCGTRFRVTETQLQAARGWVRCGTCSAVFDGVDQLVLDAPLEYASAQDALQALDALLAELMVDSRIVSGPAGPPAESGPATVPEPAPEARAQSGVEATDTLAAGAFQEMTIAPAQAPAGDVEEEIRLEAAQEPAAPGLPRVGLQQAGLEQSVPDEAIASLSAVVFGRPRRRSRAWLWLLVPLAALAIAAQVLWLRFDTLVRDPSWRPIYAELCGWIGCELPVQRAVNRIRTRNLTVQANPDGSATLQVRVVMLNEADFVQPFPTLELRFSSLSGALIAGHRFQPGEYLAGDARNLELMPVGTPVQLELTIPDPGVHAVNYQMDLK